MQKTLALVDDPLFCEHLAPAGHPERPERLHAARAAIAHADLNLRRVDLATRSASEDELVRVHTEAYLETLGQAAGRSGYFDEDTFYSAASVAAARAAAGAALVITDALIDDRAHFGLALVRPPGHHARPSGAMGFCLLNNVAIAAAHARARGVERVAIVDFDVHHGNGTQEAFYADPSVLYVSLHQSPLYPGTGAAHETGQGEGRGYNVNVPLSAGAGDTVYAAAMERIVAPILEAYQPALGTLRPEVGVGLVLEGGYDLSGLGSSLGASLEALGEGAQSQTANNQQLWAAHEADLAAAAAAAELWKLS
jgi:acetoin utilization deacetylase AcuC-like enzyme